MLKTCSKALFILIAGILLGAALLCAVYLLPLKPIKQHVRESLRIFNDEGENPFLLEDIKGSSLDNYTDALMLTNAAYESSKPFYMAAMLVERESNGKDQPIESLQDYIKETRRGEVRAYARYWHGYLVILKPLLLVMDYGEIRFLNGIVITIMLVGMTAGFIKRRMWRGLIAFIAAIIGLFPMTIPFSLQFSSIFYVSIFACLFLLWKYEFLEEYGICVYFFLIVGMLTSYMDFLTYPLFSFGMPIALYIVLSRNSFVSEIKNIVINGIAWGTGYAMMWIGKWTVGSLMTGTNLFSDALNTVAFRVSNEVAGKSVSAIMSVLRNFYIFFNTIGVGLAVFLILWMLAGSYRYRKKVLKSSAWLLLMLACMPIVWYCVTTNHSYIHYWYTFRNLSVSIFMLGLIPEYLHQENLDGKY